MKSAVASSREEKSSANAYEQAVRRKLKTLIGKANDVKLNELLQSIPDSDQLIHIVSQHTYSKSLLERANHHFFDALKEKQELQQKFEKRPQMAKNPQFLEPINERVNKLGRIVMTLANAGMGKYPEELEH